MALNKAGLETNIKAIFNKLKDYDGESSGETQADAINDMAADLADAIDIYVKTGIINTTVTVTSVSGVTVGAGVSGPGAGTGVGNIT